jgi:hypothetical protein
MTKAGVELHDVAKGRTIGVVWAGAVSYWSDLFAYDLLGKSDREIAHMPSVGKFKPGHSKYDLDFSLGVEKPDIIPAATTGDFETAAQRWGYVKIGNGFYVRLAANLDTAALARVTSFANSPP